MVVARERITADDKCEALSTLSANSILMISGFLGGLTTALLLLALVVPLIQEIKGSGAGETVIGFLAIFSLLGAIAAKFLQWEYMIKREAYKREAEFCMPLVYPFFFLCLLGFGITLWLIAAIEVPDIAVWVAVPILALAAIILGSALGAIWRFWHILWLSMLNPLDWRAIIEARNFNRQLKISFAEVKRYPSPLSLTVMDISRSGQLKGRAVRRVQEELISIIDKNVRETDAIGRIENGRVVITMAHTGSSGAFVQAKRVQEILKEHLRSLEARGKKITLSIGIASCAPDMASYKDLIKKAQIALLQASEEGRGISIEGTDSSCVKVTTEST